MSCHALVALACIFAWLPVSLACSSHWPLSTSWVWSKARSKVLQPTDGKGKRGTATNPKLHTPNTYLRRAVLTQESPSPPTCEWNDVVPCDVMWFHVMSCGVVWCHVVRCHVVWCHVVWCHAVWCHVVWCHVVWYGVMWCGVMWCGAMQVVSWLWQVRCN